MINMTQLFNQNGKIDIIAFVMVWALFFLTIISINNNSLFRYVEPFFLFFLFFGSIIYGAVLRRPKKAFLLGFLIWVSLPFHLWIVELIKGITLISDIFVLSNFTIISFVFLAFGIINGSTAYFVASSFTNPQRKLLYRGLAFVLFIITAILFFELS